MSERLPVVRGDLEPLDTCGFGWRSLTWWGVIGYMMIEGAGFAMAFGAYFFLMNNEATWPPAPHPAPNLVAGSLFTLLLLASEIPNTIAKKAAESDDLKTVQRMLVVAGVIGAVLLVLRGFEFTSLNVHWYDNAYGSILWALLILHTLHIGTDWVDTLVLTRLMFTPHGSAGRRMVDVSENSLYWRFVWLTWLPIYAMIYWVPRWF
jgi:cytochrome c oxidase subunit 3